MIFNYGDTVVIYEDRNKQSLVTLIEDGKFQNQFGSFQHSQIVNQKSGTKIYSKNQRFIYVLEPTSVLISAAVPHKTQILYSMDIAQIIQRLNLIPGSKVIETGTGSGSLSCSILNNISKDGHLYTYEFNLDRYNNGKQLFSRLNYNNVTVVHRDTCGEGFLPQNEDFQLPEIDAVFLDVPKPWEAVIHATKVLKKSGRICCFSPCIEQVQKNCETMEKYGYAEIVTIESLVRDYQTITKQDKFDFSIQEENQEEVKDEQNEKDIDEQDKDEKKDDNKRKRQNGPPQLQQQTQKKVFISSGAQSQKGHTGYLTFGIFK